MEALELSSRLAALIAGKTEVAFDELTVVVPLVLRHRVASHLSEDLKDLEMRRAAGKPAPFRAGDAPPFESGPYAPGN